jgi:hypothetical protein
MTGNRSPAAAWLPDDPEPEEPPPPVPGGSYTVTWGAGLGWGAVIVALAFLVGWWWFS